MNIVNIRVYNATTQNNREIDTVHNHELSLGTVSIKHKVKTALWFWFNAMLSTQKYINIDNVYNVSIRHC